MGKDKKDKPEDRQEYIKAKKRRKKGLYNHQ